MYYSTATVYAPRTPFAVRSNDGHYASSGRPYKYYQATPGVATVYLPTTTYYTPSHENVPLAPSTSSSPPKAYWSTSSSYDDRHHSHHRTSSVPHARSSSLSRSPSSAMARPKKYQRSLSVDRHDSAFAPTKRVRFEDDDNRSVLRPSSTTRSSRSRRSSSASKSDDLRMHPLFASSSAFTSAGSISWDVTHAPSAFTTYNRRSRTTLSGQTLREPATTPAATSGLTLVSSRLPWEITVPAGERGSITVLDVLDAVHAALSAPASPADWTSLASSAREKVQCAYDDRRAAHAHYDRRSREAEPLRRLDWLGGKTRLVGVEILRGAAVPTAELVFSRPKDY